MSYSWGPGDGTGSYFVIPFFERLGAGDSIGEAYKYAFVDALLASEPNWQRAVIDDNSDGIGHTIASWMEPILPVEGDGDLALNTWP